MRLSPLTSVDQTPFAFGTAEIFEPQTPPAQPAAAETAPGDIATELRSQVSGIEQSLTRFTQALSHELDSLEKRFAGLMRSFVASLRHLGASANAGAAASHGTGASRTADARSPRTQGQAAPSPYDGLIQRAAERHDLDPLLVDAVIRQESGFRADAVSSAGAVGLMQLMPSTARALGVSDPFDPAANVEGGTRLLRSLLDRYDGRLDLALAAYNAGPEAVDRYGGVPPYPETQAYVDGILARYREDALAQG